MRLMLNEVVMRMILRLALVVAVLMAVRLPAAGQQKGAPLRALTVSPQYWLNDGFRVDGHLQLPQRFQFLQLGLLYYADDANNDVDLFRYYSDNLYKSMTGGGIRLYHKLMVPFSNMDGEGFYLAYGPMAELFGFDIGDARWKPYTSNGVEYYQYEYFYARQYTLKYGFDILAGTQWYKNGPFMINFYMGIGLRNAYATKKSGPPQAFSYNIVDFGYKGVLMLMGLEIGGVLPQGKSAH